MSMVETHGEIRNFLGFCQKISKFSDKNEIFGKIWKYVKRIKFEIFKNSGCPKFLGMND